MFAVKLSSGLVAMRLDPDPAEGETVVDYRELALPLREWQRYDWDTDTVINFTPQEVEVELLRYVDDRRDLIFGQMLDKSGARSVEYVNKSMEAYSDVGPWPYLSALAEAKGTTVQAERDAVLQARNDAETERAAFAAMVVAGKDSIRAAESTDDKLLAYGAIPWPQEI